MKELTTELQRAIRSLKGSPGFSIAALVIFALGIGANTAIFGIVNAVLLKPLPFPESDRVVAVLHVPPPQAFPDLTQFPVSAANYLDWKKQNSVFEAMTVIGRRRSLLGSPSGDRPISLRLARTDADFFKVVGVSPSVGRAYTGAECTPGHDVIVLSDSLAKSQFGSPQNAVDKAIQLDGQSFRVIGVMPASFRFDSWFPSAADGWVPTGWTPQDAASRGNHNYVVSARLRPGVPVEQARSEMKVISERLASEYPEEDKGWGATVLTVQDLLVGDVRPALLILLGAVGFVLLIACANTANLVLARTLNRRKELAIRAALGASSSQVIRPVVVETLTLALFGGLLGLVLASYGQPLVVGALADQLPHAIDVGINLPVLLFTLIASLLTGLASGLIASWRLLRADVSESLKQGLGKTDAYAAGKGTRSALVIAEAALSLMLLVGAGLMIRTLWALGAVDPGFRSDNLVTLDMRLPEGRGFYDDFLPQVRNLAGVRSVAAIDTLPLAGGGSEQPVTIESRPHEMFALQPNVPVRRITPGYFDAMHIPLIAGRDFTRDDLDDKRTAVVISQAMANQFWPGENPIGRRLRLSFTPDVVHEVVGVVGDIRERGLDVLRPISMLYVPLLPNNTTQASVVIRTAAPGISVVAPVTSVLQHINPELLIRNVSTMNELVASSLSQRRFSMFLFVALAGLAFLLAAVGIYSVLACNVRTRVTEIGIRMALGAQVRDVLRLIISDGMRPALIGVIIGIGGASLLSSIMSSLIFGVSPTDPLTFCAVPGLLLVIAFLACLLPAWRATRVDPVTALRCD